MVLEIPNEASYKDKAEQRRIDDALFASEQSHERATLRRELAGELTPAVYRERFHLLLKVEHSQSRIDIR